MTSAAPDSRFQFEPPGPGSWTLDPVHFPRPVTRYWAEMHPEPFRRGTSEFMAFYGMLLEALEYAVRQRLRVQARCGPPPDERDPAALRSAPRRCWSGKLWREQLREWDETFKPAAITTHRELQSVDADALSDDELVAYLTRCRDHHAEMIYQHMRFTGAAMLPVGDLLAHVGDWTGLAAGRAARPCCAARRRCRRARRASSSGSSPRSRTTRPRATLLDSDGDPGKTLAAAARVRRRRRRGDVGLSRPRRLPAARRLRHLRAATRSSCPTRCCARSGRRSTARGTTTATTSTTRIAGIRAQVPERAPRASSTSCSARRASMYRLRDERGVFSDIWASGIMRRAALAAGRRLAGAGPRPRRRALRRRRLRRDVRAGRPARAGRRPTSSRSASRTAARAPPRRRRRPSGRRRRRRPTRRACRRASPGSCARSASRWASCSAARRRRTRRTCCAASPRAAASTKGPARRVSGPDRVRSHRAGRRARHRVDDRGVQHPAAAARRDRHRQRRPALALGDRGARVRHPRRGRHARTRPTSSPTARACASTATPAK